MARRLLVGLALVAWLAAIAAPPALADQPTPAPSPVPTGLPSPTPSSDPNRTPAATPGPAIVSVPVPSPAPSSQDPIQRCQQLGANDPVGIVARLGCDTVAGGATGPVRDVATGAGQAAQQAAQSVVEGAESNFDSWLADGAAWMAQAVLNKVTGSSNTPVLNPDQASAFARVYGRVVGVALMLSVLLVLIGVIEAVLTQRPGGLRRVVIGIAVSGIGMGVVPVGTSVLLGVVDELSRYVVSGQGQAIAQGLQTTIHLLRTFDATQTGGAAFAWTAFGVLLGGTVLWLELITREALVYLFLAVVPLACAAVQWPRLEGVLRQVLFGGLALILSKLVIAIALAVGFAVMATTGTGLEILLAGMFVLMLAAFSPFTLARVLPMAAEELSHAAQGRMRATMVGGQGTASRMVTAIATGVTGAGIGGSLAVARPMGRTGTPVSGGSIPARLPGRGSPSPQVVAAPSGGESDRPPAGQSAPAPEIATNPVSTVRRVGTPRAAPARGPQPPPDGGPPPPAA
jgi:hypothetical protein